MGVLILIPIFIIIHTTVAARIRCVKHPRKFEDKYLSDCNEIKK